MKSLGIARKREEGTLSDAGFLHLLLSVKSSENKGWVRRVPVTFFLSKRKNLNQKRNFLSAHAAAVIPAPRVVTTIIGLEAFVAGSVSP